MIDPAAPVAVFDSGVGGIGVLRELTKALPSENFLYFGDASNAPYGERTREQILSFSHESAGRLLRECKALVIACNTATAVAAASLRARYEEPIIGMEPAIKPALAAVKGKVLVLATSATLRGEKFRSLCGETGKDRLVPLAAPGLVPLIEAGLADSPQTENYLRELLSPHLPADAVVLGCTHFPFAILPFRRVCGCGTLFFDGAAGTARETARRLANAGLLFPFKQKGQVRITAGTMEAKRLAESLFYRKRPETVSETAGSHRENGDARIPDR